MIGVRTLGLNPLSRRLVTSVVLLCATAAVSTAQTPPATPAQDLYRWIAPTPQNQLAADQTPIPAGAGAIFVPAMSRGIDEPEVLVYQGAARVSSGMPGRRITLPPGSYTLRVGSAPLDQMMSIPVQVTAGNTTLVPVTWSALIIEVVDKNNVPHRGSYELIQVADRQPYTVGFGADTLVGEKIRTLIVAPGLYRIVRPGSNYRTRTDFSTVLVPEAAVVYYKLVLDPDTGELLGAGVVPPEELGIVNDQSAWSKQFSLGVGVPIAASSNVVGVANQTSLAADLTFDTYIIYNKNENYFSSIFELEQGVIRIDPENGPALPYRKPTTGCATTPSTHGS